MEIQEQVTRPEWDQVNTFKQSSEHLSQQDRIQLSTMLLNNFKW